MDIDISLYEDDSEYDNQVDNILGQIRDLVLDDYHESMDQQRFEQWFQKFVQNVPDKSAIVLPIATWILSNWSGRISKAR